MTSVSMQQSTIDRLLMLKALLDSGAITQEESDEQKKIIIQENR
jgi:hypothetical protein